jgi:hypothetical protein
MAERLQKTLNVQPTVASVGTPLGPDTTTAQAVEAVGGLARTFVAEKKKSDLEDELRELGDEVFAAKSGKQLEGATDRFKRLQKAREQGLLSDSMVNIEAEKVLKETIGTMPGFAPELRQEASRILGFDPTGSEIQALFGKSGASSGARPKSQLEKFQDQAAAISATTNISQEDALALVGKSAALKLQSDVAQNSLALGAINRSQFLNTKMDEVENSMFDLMGSVTAELRQGGVVNPEQAKALFSQKKEVLWAEYRRGLSGAGIVASSTELQSDRKLFDQQFASLESIVTDGSLQEVMTRKAATLAAVAKVQGFNAFPHIAVLNQVGGAPMVETWLNTLSSVQSEDQLKLISKLDPTLAALIKNPQDFSNSVTAAFNKVMGVPVSAESGAAVEPPESVVDVVTADIVKNAVDPDSRTKVLDSLRERGKAFKDFSFYSQSGVRAKATAEEVTYIKERFGTELGPLVGRIAATLEGLPDFNLSVENGVLKLNKTTIAAQAGTGQGNFGLGRETSPASLDMDIARLNAMNKLVTSGWATDVGESPVGFLERQVTQMDAIRGNAEESNDLNEIKAALDNFNKSPTADNLDILRQLAPEAVAEAERRALQRGGESESGSDQTNSE